MERLVLSAGPLGIMQSCIDTVAPYVFQRKQFGKRIGEFQLVQGMLADMYTKLSASRAYTYNVAIACDNGNVSNRVPLKKMDSTRAWIRNSEVFYYTLLNRIVLELFSMLLNGLLNVLWMRSSVWVEMDTSTIILLEDSYAMQSCMKLVPVPAKFVA